MTATMDRLLMASEAAFAREGGPLRRDGRFMRVLPFGIIAVLALLFTIIPGGSFDGPGAHPEAATASVLTVLALLIACFAVPWQRLPADVQFVIPVAYAVSVLLLRHAAGSGEPGYTILFMLPVAWVALYGPNWQLVAIALISIAFILLPPMLDGVLLGEQHYPPEDDRLTVLIILTIALVATALRITANAAGRDSLTGLPNRRAFMTALASRGEAASRAGVVLTVGIIDLDHFKQYNDANGHEAGDALLRGAGEAWTGHIRKTDIIGRVGGEEFGLVVNGDLDEAAALATRLLTAIPESQTASIGLAVMPPGTDGMEALRMADDAMYAAKRAGRARITVAAATPLGA